MRLILLLLTVVFLLCGCNAGVRENMTLTDIEYKDGLFLDIYYPTKGTASKTPALLFFHGGGWISGSRDEVALTFAPLLEALRANGVTVISADYTLLGGDSEENYVNCISDAIDCADWVMEHAMEYRINTAKIGVAGYSAGAYLALMTAFAADDEAFSGIYPNISAGKLALCVDISAPVVFTSDLNPEEDYSSVSLDSYAAYLFDPDSECYFDDLYEASVLNHLDKTDAGTVLRIYRCGADEVVREAHANELYNIAHGSELDVTLLSFPGLSHFFVPVSDTVPPYMLSEICVKIAADITEILK